MSEPTIADFLRDQGAVARGQTRSDQGHVRAGIAWIIKRLLPDFREIPDDELQHYFRRGDGLELLAKKLGFGDWRELLAELGEEAKEGDLHSVPDDGRRKRIMVSFGNSSVGSIGAVCWVFAHTAEEALEIASEAVPEMTGELRPVARGDQVDYIQAYFNPAGLTLASVEDWEYVDEEGMDAPGEDDDGLFMAFIKVGRDGLKEGSERFPTLDEAKADGLELARANGANEYFVQDEFTGDVHAFFMDDEAPAPPSPPLLLPEVIHRAKESARRRLAENPARDVEARTAVFEEVASDLTDGLPNETWDALRDAFWDPSMRETHGNPGDPVAVVLARWLEAVLVEALLEEGSLLEPESPEGHAGGDEASSTVRRYETREAPATMNHPLAVGSEVSVIDAGLYDMYLRTGRVEEILADGRVLVDFGPDYDRGHLRPDQLNVRRTPENIDQENLAYQGVSICTDCGYRHSPNVDCEEDAESDGRLSYDPFRYVVAYEEAGERTFDSLYQKTAGGVWEEYDGRDAEAALSLAREGYGDRLIALWTENDEGGALDHLYSREVAEEDAARARERAVGRAEGGRTDGTTTAALYNRADAHFTFVARYEVGEDGYVLGVLDRGYAEGAEPPETLEDPVWLNGGGQDITDPELLEMLFEHWKVDRLG